MSENNNFDKIESLLINNLAESEQTSQIEAAQNEDSTNSTQNLCKTFKKIKYEIDLQNYKINKLKRALKTCGIPPKKARQMEKELQMEMCKLGEMIQCVMKKGFNNEENCEWGSISLIQCDSDDDFLLMPPETPSDISNISGCEEYAYTEMLLSDNEMLAESVHKLQGCILKRDETACCLQRKIAYLEQQLEKLTKGSEKVAHKMEGKPMNYEKLNLELKHYVDVAETLSCNINRMDMYLKELRNEFNCLKNVKSQTSTDIVGEKVGGEEIHDAKIKDLHHQYSTLLKNFCQKETTNRLKKCSNNKNCNSTESTILHKESEKLINEIEDYRLMVKELQTQVDLYRDKFMKAQEKVEKQKIQLKQVECTKQQIESQVNEELKKIKGKFEQKLAEMCPFPKKYEESQKELKLSLSRMQEMEKKLCETTEALTKARCELKIINDKPQEINAGKCEKLKMEIEELKRSEAVMKKMKECLEEELCKMKSELKDLRENSSKIIATTKCCADKNRDILHEQINCLEMQLAQCRAASSLSLAEKEESIKTLKHELCLLCDQLNNSQNQIKQLKEQINNLNENCYKNTDCYQIFANK